MKQECLTYLKTIGKSKAFAATLSDTEPKDDFDNEDGRILNAFTAIINPTKRIVEDVDEEEELVESKFKKMDEQDDIHTAYAKLYKVLKKHKKLYRLATKKLSEVELEREEISTKSSSLSTSSTIPLVGFIVAVKAFRIPSSLLSESSSSSVLLKVVVSALLFPMVLRYVGHSCFMCPKP